MLESQQYTNEKKLHGMWLSKRSKILFLLLLSILISLILLLLYTDPREYGEYGEYGDFGPYKIQGVDSWLEEFPQFKIKCANNAYGYLQSLGNQSLTVILTTMELKVGWWKWGKFGKDLAHGLRREVEKNVKNILKGMLDKGTETTVASVYLAIKCVRNGLHETQEKERFAKAIHDVWCKVNAKYEDKETLISKRSAQYQPYDKLSEEEKAKDYKWIDSVEDNWGAGLRDIVKNCSTVNPPISPLGAY